MSNKNITYNPGTLKPLLQIVTSLIKQNPEYLENVDYLRAALFQQEPALKRTDLCFNCWASMAEYWFEFDVLDAILLNEMGKAVDQRVQDKRIGGFTEANQVMVQKLGMSLSIQCRTTQCSKLGLIAQLRTKDGTRVPGVWVITSRGFDALAGVPVPKRVKVWRNRIVERSPETITIAEAFKSHTDKVLSAIAKNKQPKSDYRRMVGSYDQSMWVHYGGEHEGQIKI